MAKRMGFSIARLGKLAKLRPIARLLLRNLLLPLMLVIPAFPSLAQDPVEYKIKTSLIYNFLKFVEWPVEVSKSSLRICISNEGAYGELLRQLEGQLVHGRRITVSKLVVDMKGECQVIVFDESVKKISEYLVAVKNDPVLTIGQSEDFTSYGGIINFKIVDQTVQFQINQKQAQKNRLGISAKLLRLAYGVEN